MSEFLSNANNFFANHATFKSHCRVSFRGGVGGGGGGGGIRPPLENFLPPLKNSKFQFLNNKNQDYRCNTVFGWCRDQNHINTGQQVGNFCKLQLLVIEKEMKYFYHPDWPRLHQNQSQRT